MRTKDGYIKLCFGYSWLFFLEESTEALGECLVNEQTLALVGLAILELNVMGHYVASQHDSIKSELDLQWYIKTGRGV